MKQARLAKGALKILETLPERPAGGRYLSWNEAERIVDETLSDVKTKNDPVEFQYMAGHRRRFIETLTLTPKAETADASLLDVGCYGYFGFWAIRNLGYARVVGIEMPLESGTARSHKKVSVGDATVEIDVRHFDLTDPDWPVDEMFETALCLEVLEHVGVDPAGVMDRLRDRIVMGGTLVFSVPNGVSHKTLREFLSGMPPWTYWFFNPDLAHEPRHAFEYTPFVKALMLKSLGFEQLSFKTIDAYSERESIADLYQIGAALGCKEPHFGETMISVARKVADKAAERYPDAIYSGDGYYKSTWPLIDQRKRATVARFQNLLSENDKLRNGIQDAEIVCSKLRSEAHELTHQLQEMAYLLDVYEQRSTPPKGGMGAEQRRELLMYQLAAPGGVTRIAESAVLPSEMSWFRQFCRHPLRVSEWRGLRRVQRRAKNVRFRALVQEIFG